MSFLAEIWAFMRSRKKYWLIPLIVVLAFVGAMVVLAKGSAVAPFIYAVF